MEKEETSRPETIGGTLPAEEESSIERDSDPTKPVMTGWSLREHHLFVEALRKSVELMLWIVVVMDFEV